MKKFLAVISAVLFVSLNAAPAQNKIPASATVGVTVNLEQIFSWPLFQQLAGQKLQTELAKAQLTAQDIQGEIALGVTFARKNPKENLRIDVVLNLKKNNAEKLFSLAEKELTKNPGITRKKEAGKPCLEDETIKLILTGKHEITLQIRLGQDLKFIKLAPAKNIFTRIPAKNATLTAAFDNQKILRIFAKEIPPQAAPLLTGKLFSCATFNCLSDGSLNFQLTDTFKSNADCKKSLDAFNAQLATLKENPAVSMIADKIKAKVNRTTLTVSGNLSSVDLQMAAGSIMMMMMAQQQNMTAPAAN